MERGTFHSVGILRNYKLEFIGHSALWKGAIATIIPEPGSSVWGCIWRAKNTIQCREDLDSQERGYHKLNGNFS